MHDKLRVGVVGVGHFGRNHARVYSELDGVELVGVADVDPACVREVAAKHRTGVFDDPREMLGKLDAVSVAVPARDHARVSCDFLKNGIAVLVEKPMASTVEEARAIQSAARESGATLQVGHILRFTPGVRALCGMNVVPRLIHIRRMGPPGARAVDVGVVLDLMIHDIDLVLQLVRAPLRKVDVLAFSAAEETEDMCSARLTFDDGCVADLAASRVAPGKTRTIRVFSSDGCISLDFDSNRGFDMRRSEASALGALDAEALKDLPDDRLRAWMQERFFTLREMTLDGEEPLRAELQSFVNCVRNRVKPEVTGEDGVRAMVVAGKVLEAIRRRKSES